jgi:hypothetical protein
VISVLLVSIFLLTSPLNTFGQRKNKRKRHPKKNLSAVKAALDAADDGDSIQTTWGSLVNSFPILPSPTLRVDTWCQRGNDTGPSQGNEDLYFIIAGKDAAGRDFSSRYPDRGSFNLDCHNRGTERLRKFSLWEADVAQGASTELTIFVMESDGGPEQKALDAALEAARQTAKDDSFIGTAVQFAQVLSNLFANDDFIGSVGVRVSRPANGGPVQTEVTPKEHCTALGTEQGKLKFKLQGGGAEYHLRLWLVNGE